MTWLVSRPESRVHDRQHRSGEQTIIESNMKENHLLATSTFHEPKTQDQKLKS